jgi:hypothetical protein
MAIYSQKRMEDCGISNMDLFCTLACSLLDKTTLSAGKKTRWGIQNRCPTVERGGYVWMDGDDMVLWFADKHPDDFCQLQQQTPRIHQPGQ